MGEASRTRLSIDLSPELRRRVKVAAARRAETVQQYVQAALERRLADDASDALHASDDPVLGALWNNDADAVYDDL